MRAPVPFIPPTLPVVASALIRDDVALGDIAAADWNALAGSQPFLSHAFLTALHETGCASPETGWSPRFLTAWHEGTLIGALPRYSKTHSYGEYVFDWGWADAYRRHGRRYYPKWVVAVPFTPVPGPRVLAADAMTRRALLQHAVERCQGGWPFVVARPVPDCHGSLGRRGNGHDSSRRAFNFTGPTPVTATSQTSSLRFTHDKRKKVKQERRRVAEAGVTFERIRGRSITADDWAFFYRRYEQTYREHQSTPVSRSRVFRTPWRDPPRPHAARRRLPRRTTNLCGTRPARW